MGLEIGSATEESENWNHSNDAGMILLFMECFIGSSQHDRHSVGSMILMLAVASSS